MQRLRQEGISLRPAGADYVRRWPDVPTAYPRCTDYGIGLLQVDSSYCLREKYNGTPLAHTSRGSVLVTVKVVQEQGIQVIFHLASVVSNAILLLPEQEK